MKQNIINNSNEPEIDWFRVPTGLDWLAIDSDGSIYAFNSEPDLGAECWNSIHYYELITEIVIENPPSDWKQCKFKRP